MPPSHFDSLPGGATSYRDVQKQLLSKRCKWLQLWDNKWRDFHLGGNNLLGAGLFAETDDFKTNVRREV
jgi:hypothetical protein